MGYILTDNKPQIDYVILIKDTHREKATSNKTPVLTKSMNMVMRAVGT